MKLKLAHRIGWTLCWGALILFCLSVRPAIGQERDFGEQVSSRRRPSRTEPLPAPAHPEGAVVMLPTVIEDHQADRQLPRLSHLPVLPPEAPLASSRRTVIASEMLVTPALALEQGPPPAAWVTDLQPLPVDPSPAVQPPTVALLPLLEPMAVADESPAEADESTGAEPVAAVVDRTAELLQPLEVQPAAPEVARVRMSDLSNVEFADPAKFLKKHQFKFANPEKFLVETSPGVVEAPAANDPPRSVSPEPPPIRRRPTRTQEQVADAQEPGDRRQYLTVSDVNQPLAENPFDKLEQADPSGLLQAPVPLPPAAFTDTYASLTGRAFQAHFASWNAHRFNHRPLYFEEVNLERYGNRLRFQELASGAHFFTSALLLPYQMGDQPPGSCVSTLGHERPGSCVPFQPHVRGLSRRGLFVQGLFVTALSL